MLRQPGMFWSSNVLYFSLWFGTMKCSTSCKDSG